MRDSDIFVNSSMKTSFGRIHFEYIPKIRDQEINLVRQDEHVFVNFFHMGAIFCFFPANFMSSTYTDKNNPCFRWTNRHSEFATFSHPRSNTTSSNCLSHKRPSTGFPYKFRSRSTTRSSMFDHDFGHLCRGRRILTSGLSDSESVEQSGSILQCYLSAGRYCISCLSITTS